MGFIASVSFGFSMELSLFGTRASTAPRLGLHSSRGCGCCWSLHMNIPVSRMQASGIRPNRLPSAHAVRQERLLSTAPLQSRR